MLLAIAVHVVLGVVVWRVGARFGVWAGGNPGGAVVEDGGAKSRIPVIMQAVEAIHAMPDRAPLAAFSDSDGPVEWRYEPHDRVGLNLTGEGAPLIGYQMRWEENSVAPLRVKK